METGDARRLDGRPHIMYLAKTVIRSDALSVEYASYDILSHTCRYVLIAKYDVLGPKCQFLLRSTHNIHVAATNPLIFTVTPHHLNSAPTSVLVATSYQ